MINRTAGRSADAKRTIIGVIAVCIALVSPAYAEEDYVTAIIRALEGATSPGMTTNSGQPNSGGSALHLGMYAPSDYSGQSGSSLATWGGAFDITSGGYLEKTSIGPVTTVTKSPSFRDTLVYGGIYGIYDASRFVPTNQSLSFFGTVNIAQDNLTFGPGPLPGEAVSVGSDKVNLDFVAGSVRWSIDNLYFKGLGMAIYGKGTQFSAFDNGFGRYTTRAYAVDATIGDIFVLYNSKRGTPAAPLPTKAPPQQGDIGYMLGLDLSGHVGYADIDFFNGYTDSAGVIWGNFEGTFPMLGAAAKLFATIPGGKFQWMPYVRGALDDYPGISFTLAFPSQPAFPIGDLQTFLPASTFWTGELGLDVQNDAGVTVGIKGFYMASSDTVIKYVGASVKIPLDFAPRVAARY